MITASHNPAADNGYKLYVGDGAQIVPPVDAEISAAIDAVGALADVPMSHEGIEEVGPALVEAYVAGAVALLVPGGARDVRLVHTSMHGVGGSTARAVLVAAGFPAPIEVAARREPDPDFPTVAFPNPEEPGALDLALALAAEQDADLVLANDPDADRLAVAARMGPDGGVAGALGRRARLAAGRPPAPHPSARRPRRAGHHGRVLPPAVPPRRRGGRRVRRGPHRLQVGRPRPGRRAAAAVRLRGGPRLQRRPPRARQGRHHRGPRRRRAGGGPASGGDHAPGPARRPAPPPRRPRHRSPVAPRRWHRLVREGHRGDGGAAVRAADRAGRTSDRHRRGPAHRPPAAVVGRADLDGPGRPRSSCAPAAPSRR